MSSQARAEASDIAILADSILRKSDLEAFATSLEASVFTGMQSLRAQFESDLARMERRLTRAYALVPLGLVLGVSFVPLIAERLFG